MKTNLQHLWNRFWKNHRATLATVALGVIALTPKVASANSFTFDLVRSKGLTAFPKVAPAAHGQVTIQSVGPVEIMDVKVWGLPPNTDFDLFVIQVPNAPFGLSWYQGDIETDQNGVGTGQFIGRFSIETFIVSPASLPAPIIFHNAFPDVSPGVATGPVHTYHLGLWFNSPADAAKAGCGNAVTPFNGDHNAGVQALSTTQFADQFGPLRSFKP